MTNQSPPPRHLLTIPDWYADAVHRAAVHAGTPEARAALSEAHRYEALGATIAALDAKLAEVTAERDDALQKLNDELAATCRLIAERAALLDRVNLAESTLARAGWEYISDAAHGPIWKPPVNTEAAKLRAERDALAARLAEIERPMHIGACIDDGVLYATVMRKGSDGAITVVAQAELCEATLHGRDCITKMLAPAKREPLTDEQIGKALNSAGGVLDEFVASASTVRRFVRAIERAHDIGATATHCRTCGPDGCPDRVSCPGGTA